MTRKDYTLLVAFILLIIVILLSACTDKATRHLRKSEKHLRKAITAGAIVNPDTIWKTLFVPVPYVRKDTVFQTREGDTVWIREDRLRIRYIDRPGDTVEISGECLADTIVKEVPVTVTQNVTVPVKDNKWKWIAIGLGVIIVLLFLIRR